MPSLNMQIREIKKNDNIFLFEIIRSVMNEFHVNPIGTILSDPTVIDMFQNYRLPRSVYYVLEENDAIVGGCGINKLYGGPDNICELQRLFLLPVARGKGYGKLLLDRCIEKARNEGYEQIYLETLSVMHDAIRLYELSGFDKINAPLGNTGHGGCDVFMVKIIQQDLR